MTKKIFFFTLNINVKKIFSIIYYIKFIIYTILHAKRSCELFSKVQIKNNLKTKNFSRNN